MQKICYWHGMRRAVPPIYCDSVPMIRCRAGSVDAEPQQTDQGYIPGAWPTPAQVDGLDECCIRVVVLGYCGRYLSFRGRNFLRSTVAGIKK